MTAQTILPANSVTDTGYDVGNSIQFNGSNSVMQRDAAGTPSSTKIWSISFWTKRCRLGTTEVVWMHQNAANHTAKFQLGFHSTDTFRIETYDGTNEYNLSTDMKFMDTSAWYSLLVNVDSTQGTEANRYKIFVNGIQAAVTETGGGYPAQNWDLDLGSQKIALGRYQAASPSAYYDGYVAEVVYADGQTLAPTDIGEFDSASGIFKPIDVSGLTLGNAGFYIDFSDSSDLGATTGNDFALTNLAATDQSTDTCTNNFAILNSNHSIGAQTELTEGNLEYDPSGHHRIISTIAPTRGKWYAEVKGIDSPDKFMAGVAHYPMPANGDASSFAFGDGVNADVGRFTNDFGVKANGQYGNSNSYANYMSQPGNNDIIGIYLDLDNYKIYLSLNGTLGSATGKDLTNNGEPYGFISVGEAGTFQWNFGNPSFALANTAITDDNGYGAFEYSPNITGDGAAKKFYSLCTKNLAEFG